MRQTRSNHSTKREFHSTLLTKLERAYPAPASELNFSNDYELLISVVLSAQCTDKKVNQVTAALFPTYPDFRSLADAEITDIEKIIREVNYYRTKAKHLKALAGNIMESFDGELPDTREGLESLPGVGRKTASVVLSERGIEEALAVDTHVFRVARRLGLSHQMKRDQVEQDLMKQFPASVWRSLHHWLILHGRRICKAQRPLCSVCSLAALCPSFEKIE
jgi:endonuclease III